MELLAATRIGLILLLIGWTASEGECAPSLEATPLEPLLAVAGDSVLIDCVAKSLNNYTIIWRRAVPGSNKTEILSAGEVRIIPDPRFALLHQKGHDTWVLQIQKAQVNDSGRYVCEVNTSPRMQIYRLLSVVERVAPNPKAFPVDHNYTSCCVNHGVPPSCQEFCSLQSVVMGGHPNPWQCMDHLPHITRCLTDGRNHVPCCVRQNIPEVCRSVCSGDYGLTTVLQHYACMDHTVPTLACIAEGIELLPGPPREVSVEALSETELQVRWLPPTQEIPVDTYILNLTLVNELSDIQELLQGDQKKVSKDVKKPGTFFKSFMKVKVEGNRTSYTASGLRPESLYEVQLTSINAHGSSLPSAAARALTLAAPAPTPAVDPNPAPLPNITRCCEEKGVPEGRCLRTLCDPADDDDAKLSDVMMCADYVNVTFSCLAGGVDHSTCCRQRGLPDLCLDFCRGEVDQLDYSSHLACLDHLDVFGNCLLEHHRVLPSPPLNFLVSVVKDRWAVFKWSPPNYLAESVRSYVLYWKEVATDEISEYHVVSDVRSPHLLDNLQPKTRYEVYVAARNSFGTSRGSVRAVFTTSPGTPAEETAAETKTYNETACCVAAGIKKACIDLCSYQLKMSDLQLLSIPCSDQLEVLARCGAGGRDHSPCCQRRGVRAECLPLCAATPLPMGPQAVVSTCIADAGKIIQCMSEGVGLLPEAPEDLHTMSVLPTRVRLKWSQRNDSSSSPVWYEVRYTEAPEGIPPHPLDYGYIENTTEPEFDLQQLKSDAHYSVYVVAMNEHGASLPSLVLLLHTPPRDEIYNETLQATLGPPHSLEVTHQTMDSVSLRWRAPFHVPTNASLSYLIRYQAVGASEEVATAASTQPRATLAGLALNTQYAVWVQARTDNRQSPLSEAVLAWTDPAIPAFVDPPVLVGGDHPQEGVNVTLLCVATGAPTPQVSMLIDGVEAVSRRQSHVAWVIPNIGRNVSRVDCLADNGVGQAAQSSTLLEVHFVPQVEMLEKRIPAEEGGEAAARCLVSGRPEPRVLWYRDRALREPLKKGPHYDLDLKPQGDMASSYMATLTVRGLGPEHEGQYFCYAENQLGKDTVFVNLDVLPKMYSDAAACCREKNVSAECQDACAVDIDIESALNKPHCFRDLDKLMYCAADGSDHRKCCRERGIGRSCLRWCQGRPILNTQLCILNAAKIVSCFEEGKTILPGPPRNVQYHLGAERKLEVTWDTPQKNPKVVQWYKIFWRPIGSRTMFRNHTKQRSISLDNLESGTSYEVVVKAGNHYGISQYSEPLTFTVTGIDRNGNIMTEPSGYSTSSSVAKTVAAVVGTIVFLLLIGGLGIFFYQRHRLMKPPPGIAPGVSFENPTYMKDNLPQPNSTGGSTLSEQTNGDSKREVQIKANGTSS